MKVQFKILIIVLLLAAVGIIVGIKITPADAQDSPAASPMIAAPAATETPTTAPLVTPPPQTSLPHLIDLGADKCIPCKAMAPILEQLKHDFDGQFRVTFMDVWKNPTVGETYGVQMIPTQIFFDGNGKELFRHTGFYSRDEILAKWKELGFDFHAKVVAP